MNFALWFSSSLEVVTTAEAATPAARAEAAAVAEAPADKAAVAETVVDALWIDLDPAMFCSSTDLRGMNRIVQH